MLKTRVFSQMGLSLDLGSNPYGMFDLDEMTPRPKLHSPLPLFH